WRGTRSAPGGSSARNARAGSGPARGSTDADPPARRRDPCARRVRALLRGARPHHGRAAPLAPGVARLVSRWVSWKLDPILLRVTGGRVATTLVFPTAVLETVGAKSGARRRHGRILFPH